MFWFSWFMLVSLGEGIFMGEHMILESFELFMLSIFPLIWLILKEVTFNFLSFTQLKFFNLSFFFILFFLSLCFCSSSGIFFLFFFECCVVFIFFLVSEFSKDQDKVSSVFFMFFMNICFSIPFMFFAAVSGYVNFLVQSSASLNSNFIVFFSFLAVLFSKLPVFFLHFWLTKAHVSASGPGSMVLASLLLKIGSFGLFKFSFLFFYMFWQLAVLILWFCFWGLILVLVSLIRSFDFKGLVAWSSIFHMGMIVPGVLSESCNSELSSFFMMLGHGVVSCFLFFFVSCLYEFNFHRSFDFNAGLSSAGSTFSMFIFFLVLFNMGFPPLINFFSEFIFTSFVMFSDYISLFLWGFSLLFGVAPFLSFIFKIFFSKKLTFNFETKLFNLKLSLFWLLCFSILLFLPFLF